MRTKIARFVLLLFAGSAIFALRIAAQTDEGENIILGKPTAGSVLVHALADEGTTVFAEYGDTAGELSRRTGDIDASPDGTAVVAIEGLDADTRYFYRLSYRDPGEREFRQGEEHSFHTQRRRGATFTFGVQGDSHPERNETAMQTPRGQMYSADLYALTLGRVASDRPDLYFMLGDDFSISNQVPDYFQGNRSVLTQRFVDDIYINQRRFLGLMAHSTALFPVNGNHEEARLSLLGTVLHDVSIFAGRARNRYFPVPTADEFYSGNPVPVEGIGLLGDYFAFEWGDALFVSLDPYWHSPRVPSPIGGMGMGTASTPPWDEIVDEYNELTRHSGDPWDNTIGDAQYEWFKNTLKESDAEHKFVFIHHVLGDGRGGIERATEFEWGGNTPVCAPASTCNAYINGFFPDGRWSVESSADDAVWEFDTQRPNWELPIHQLMVENGVTILFQSHDHIFVQQELDGIVYQTVPNPADYHYQAHNRPAYRTGDILGNSGYLNVTVSPDEVRVDYIRSYLPEDETDGRRHGSVDYSYIIE